MKNARRSCFRNDFSDLGKYNVYENPDFLPIAMIATNGIVGEENDYSDLFDNLNNAWTAISGVSQNVFAEEDDILFTPINFATSDVLTGQKAREIVENYKTQLENEKEDDSSRQVSQTLSQDSPSEFSSCIEYSWTAKQDGYIFTYNHAALSETSGSIMPATCGIGFYRAGDTVRGYIPVNGDYVTKVAMEEICGRFRAAYVNMDTMQFMKDAILDRQVTLNRLSDNHLTGQYTIDKESLLMFTIPYDEGWTCWIDGEKVPIDMVLGVFMAVDAPEGTHSYEMKFFPTGMKTGIGLSAAALLTTVLYIPLDSQRRKRKSVGESHVTIHSPMKE